MKSIWFSLVIFFCSSWAAAGELILDFKKIAGKSKNDVISVLGLPKKCFKKFEENIYSCNFRDGTIEIYFVSDRADWITISGLEKYPYKIESIKSIGLIPTPNSKPTLKGGFITHYEPYLGYQSVMLGEGKEGKLSYISIKVHTLNYGQFTATPEAVLENKYEEPKELKDIQRKIDEMRAKLKNT